MPAGTPELITSDEADDDDDWAKEAMTAFDICSAVDEVDVDDEDDCLDEVWAKEDAEEEGDATFM